MHMTDANAIRRVSYSNTSSLQISYMLSGINWLYGRAQELTGRLRIRRCILFARSMALSSLTSKIW
jgi:hypothetical protein